MHSPGSSHSLRANRSFIEHFKWEPETGTKLWKFDRTNASWSAYETEALFCYHVVNTFEDGDDVVLDFIAYDDAKVVEAPRTEEFVSGQRPATGRRYVRARLRPGTTRVELELLSNQSSEVPAIAYRRQHGKPYHAAWGASFSPGANRWNSQVVRVDTERADVRSFGESDVVYGEPVFVPRPHAKGAHDGVILSLGSHQHKDRASLAVRSTQRAWSRWLIVTWSSRCRSASTAAFKLARSENVHSPRGRDRGRLSLDWR